MATDSTAGGDEVRAELNPPSDPREAARQLLQRLNVEATHRDVEAAAAALDEHGMQLLERYVREHGEPPFDGRDPEEFARLATEQMPRLPSRPGDDDSRAAWVDYVVALGADRAFVEGQAPYTEWERVDDVGLRELADRLGG